MDEIKRKMDAGETGMLLIVPEQYSHDAERQLCAVCGDRLSLFAETLSFTRLYGHVLSEIGRAPDRTLDGSGQILAMNMALESVSVGLKVFGTRKMRADILEKLLEAVKEFRSLNITPQTLESTAERAQKPLSDKLRDLALVYEAYNALLKAHGGDKASILALLADSIAGSFVGNTGHIYFDGFNDFTAQELRIIEELMKKNADMTVCLTCDLDDSGEIFEIPRKTATLLSRMAKTVHGTDPHILILAAKEDESSVPNRVPELVHIEKHLFDDAPPEYRGQRGAAGQNDAIKLYKAPSAYAECQYAAATVWELVRSGYRWREIGVMARNWEDYASICENVFEKYGIPYFSSGRADVLGKPPLALIDAALEIAISGWEYKSVFRYLKTGLPGITTDDCAMLENYVLKWQIRGSMWMREWTLPPSGYRAGYVSVTEDERDKMQLKRINELRVEIIKPLADLRNGIRGDSDAETKLRALYGFLVDISLPERLKEKANEFRKRGEMRLADEYTQLPEIIINAMDQMYTILGNIDLGAVEFRKLLTIILSQYDVGVIPVSLDRITLGGMAMSRRRDLKCLLILGATDENMPALGKSGGVLSDNERAELSRLGADIPAGLEERLYREMNMLYSTLTLPSDKLILMYPTGESARPSFVIKRLSAMFGITEETVSEERYMSAARAPYHELMLGKKRPDRPAARRQLSKQAAKLLYGEQISVSATRVDRYYSCPYKHFLQNGLRLEPRLPAEFDAASAGILTHYVLENVFREIKAGPGFKDISEMQCRELTKRHIEKFVQEVLFDFEGKNARFEYLFRRYEADISLVVSDTLDELKSSRFQPLDLEFDIAGLTDEQRGYIDRVDGYRHNGRLYMRVIDYKTRKSAFKFDLSDVLHGRSMQMLIYLFVLEKFGKTRYAETIEPAGVLYVPARDVIVSAARNAEEAEIEEKRRDQMRRSGLVLDDPAIIEAMESGDVKKYLPVKTSKEGTLRGDSLVSGRQIALLSKHTDKMLDAAKKDILSGENTCSPYYKSAADNACNYCEYFAVCGFDAEMGDKRSLALNLKPEEAWEQLEEI